MRQAAEVVMMSRQRHTHCIVAWNALAKVGNLPSLWFPNPSDSKYSSGCRAAGGHPLFLQARGNDTSLFPDSFVMCLPRECEDGASFLRESLLPNIVFLQIYHREALGGPPLSTASLRQGLRSSKIEVSSVVTLPAEGTLAVDFAIAGFPLSGTTTLARELSKHPEVVMGAGAGSHPNYEDDLFWKYVHTRKRVRQWSRALEPKVALKSAASGGRRILVGLKEPMMVFHKTPMRILAGNPKAKVILLVREPLSMLSSFGNHGCDWFNHHGIGLLREFIPLQDFLGISRLPPEVVGLQNFEARENAQDMSYRPFMRRRHDFCEGQMGATDFQFAARSFVRSDVQELEKMLQSQGWPKDLWGLRAPACPRATTLRHAMGEAAAVDSICHVTLVEEKEVDCFAGDFWACERCCEQMEDGCDAYGAKYAKCCDIRRSKLLSALVLEMRKRLCSGSKQPCEVGRGRKRWATTP